VDGESTAVRGSLAPDAAPDVGATGYGPDVSVVLPVYNTRPYLTRCLDSLAEQTIGLDRLQIIAVDDGSTDGSGPELDRFARRHPASVTVVHQANSGGPAAPCNVGLALARGRYVFFLGADDYLGPQALARLVAAADRHGSDIVLGRMVGVNNRYSHSEIFAETRVDVDLYDSALPFALANTKLFRRELITRHGLAFPEDMPMASDQPFTLAACVHARRISVLADYDYYFVVRRRDGGNITYSSSHLRRLDSVRTLMAFVADRIPAGPRRDAVLVRHFTWEAAKLLADDFLQLDPAVQRRIRDGVADLVRRHLSDGIAQRLDALTWLRLRVATHGTLENLRAVIQHDVEVGTPGTVVDGGRLVATYPGYDHPSTAEGLFDVTSHAASWLARFDATGVELRNDAAGPAVVVTARSPARLADLGAGRVELTAGGIPGRGGVTAGPAGTALVAWLRVGELLADTVPLGGRRPLTVTVTAAGRSGSAPVRAPGVDLPRPMLSRRGTRVYLVAPRRDHTGQIVISVVPVTLRRVWADLRGRLTRRRG
jgi:glycosyltransferase involved in cell wall biosynthesis